MSEQDVYYLERVNLNMTRLQVMSIIGACSLALKHPDYPEVAADRMRRMLRGLCTLVDRYAPADVLAEWSQVLGLEGKESEG